MRILIKCPNCQRRYDASRFKIGSRVRCGCGQVMRVQQPRSHDAAVVRCSSCGSPREGGAVHCTFCESDFTLHERDLHTVCPQCLARVSDRARYCHACGDRLAAEAMAGESSSYTCPACGDGTQLVLRRLGKERVSVAECQRCAGLWIHPNSFCELRDRVARGAVDARLPPRPVKRRQTPQGVRYRPCAECGKLMNRREYARGCGVIVDVCREHGIWFDDEELADLLDWIARGGKGELRVGFRSPRESLPSQPLPADILAAQALLGGDANRVERRTASPEEQVESFLSDIMQAALLPLTRFLDL